MSAAAAAAAGPMAGDLPVNVNTTTDQEAWVNMDPFRYMDLCERAYQDGDFSYVQVALRANHLGLSNFINNRLGTGPQEVSNAEAFQMLRMAQKTNSVILALTMGAQHSSVTLDDWLKESPDWRRTARFKKK